MKQLTTDKLKLITAMSVFGTVGIFRRYIPYPSSVIAFIRAVIGVVFLIIVLSLKKEAFSKEAIKKNLLVLCLSGALLGANWITLFESYCYTSVSVATMCYNMAPVIMILVSPIVLHEPITKKKGICAAVAVFGMVLVSGILETGISGAKGILFGLASAVLYASVVILNKFITDISANIRSIVQLGVAAVAVLPYVLWTEDMTKLDTSFFVVAMMLIVGIVHTGMCYALYFDSVKSLSAQTVALFSYIDPIIAVVLSVVILKESLSIVAVIGVILVLGAMAVSEMPGRKSN